MTNGNKISIATISALVQRHTRPKPAVGTHRLALAYHQGCKSKNGVPDFPVTTSTKKESLLLFGASQCHHSCSHDRYTLGVIGYKNGNMALVLSGAPDKLIGKVGEGIGLTYGYVGISAFQIQGEFVSKNMLVIPNGENIIPLYDIFRNERSVAFNSDLGHQAEFATNGYNSASRSFVLCVDSL
jgi:hypothetical protein